MANEHSIDKWPINQLAKTSEKISSIRELQDPKIERVLKPKKTVRVALVCLSPMISEAPYYCDIIKKQKDKRNTDPCTRGRMVMNYQTEKVKDHYSQYHIALDYALNDRKADIVSINELGFPANTNGPDPDAIKHSSRLMRHYNSLVFAGTYHDHRTMYNSGRVYYPRCENPDNCYYHKQISAVKTKPPEIISIPPQRTTLAVKAFGIKIAIAICCDVLDFATVASVVQPENIHLLLIPSFSERIDTMKTTARFISQAMSGMVAITNFSEPANTSGFLYHLGEPIQLRETPIPNDMGKIYTYDIADVETFKDDVRRHRAELPDNIRWLFALPDKEDRKPMVNKRSN